VIYPIINCALTMWCDHPSTKAVTFLVNHVNRASHLRSATNGAMPPAKAMAASRSQHDPARVLALVGPTLGLAARIANL
jgi:peptidoglycan hydrolase-like amidase